MIYKSELLILSHISLICLVFLQLFSSFRNQGINPTLVEKVVLIQWNHEPCHLGPPKMDRSWWKLLTKHGPLEKEWQTPSVVLLWEPQEQYEKAKRSDTRRWAPQVSRCPICYWGRRKNSSRRRKRQSQSRNGTQLWMCLVVKVKSDAVKSNIT